jgi:DNA-binding YbaB/EbfC family protein
MNVVNPGGAPNMAQLMKQAQQMQEQLLAAQEQLSATEVTGTAGGGLVRATVSGSGELLALQIGREAVDPDDIETLQDLIVAAVRDANTVAAAAQERAMGPLAGGFDLGGLGGPGAGTGGLDGPGSGFGGLSLPGPG